MGGTYGGNPVACAAALAASETIEQDDLVERGPRDRGRAAVRGCARWRERYDIIGDVRGRGAMVAIELVHPGTHEPDLSARRPVAKRLPRQGVVVLTAGTYGNVLRLLPPLVISDALLDEGLTIIEEAFAQL